MSRATRVALDARIGDLLGFYQTERRIFGRCPHCDEAFRLSEVKLTYGKEPPRDALSRLKAERDKLEQELDEKEEAIESMEIEHEAEMQERVQDLEGKHRVAVEALDRRWRKRVDLPIERRLADRVQEIRRQAVEQSRVSLLGKTIERIAPIFSGFGHHPSDVRPLFEPLDFVVFDGLFTGEVHDVVFLEFKTGENTLTPVQRSIRNAVSKKRVHFEERRMSRETLRKLALGRRAADGALAIEVIGQ